MGAEIGRERERERERERTLESGEQTTKTRRQLHMEDLFEVLILAPRLLHQHRRRHNAFDYAGIDPSYHMVSRTPQGPNGQSDYNP
mmetsp:Transcript_78962/g.124661  ORF Transcript_78962/g.124661 Transcript_78962/m.124661 type:complete len:86 (-) Transcript_78962:832-1089(-)